MLVMRMSSDPDLRLPAPPAQAIYDTLAIVDCLSPIAGGGTLGEVHAFAYLSCLLALFEGLPASRWGYQFTAVPPTLPYSPALTDATRLLEAGHLLHRRGSTYHLTLQGSAEQRLWSGLKQNSWRNRYISGATGASLLTGLPSVSNDLVNEPQLKRASKLGQARELLDPDTLVPLYEQFAALRQAVGVEHQDLLTPAAIYLTFLSSEVPLEAPDDEAQE